MGKINWSKLMSCRCSCARKSEQNEDHDPSGPLPNSSEGKDVVLIKNIQPYLTHNGAIHHTSRYDLMKRHVDAHLVVRRGQPFTLGITLNRPYDEKKDLITFIFKVEDDKRPTYGKGTLVVVSLSTQNETSFAWKAVLEKANQDTITVQITPSPDCIIARWKMEVDTKTNDTHTFIWKTHLYILFNPWCQQDQVYMNSKDWLDEAVLDSDGLIWRGTSNNFQPMAWKYAQYENDILDCSLYLISKVANVRGHFRSDPIEISRALSAAVNVQDDNGVIVGNWSNKYSGGTPPYQWNGSLEILREYYKNKKPVKYGQCWVFAGVLTTVCRALGLPSRVVTNFSSAHDTDGSITIDHIVDAEGKALETYSDSIWNFHVWSEVWMKRPDLGTTYDGWQAIDATPQEASNGMYRCGPASVVACRQGDVKKPYDVPFVFAEVNADMLFWHFDATCNSLKLLRKNTYDVGKYVSTKAPGKFERFDLTDFYKYKENSEEERAINLKAVRQAEHMFSRFYINESFEDVLFKFEFLDDIVIGNPFDITLKLSNKSPKENHTVNAILRVDAITYTGKLMSTVKTQRRSAVVNSNRESKFVLNVTYDEYSKFLMANSAFKISCLADVQGTNFHYFDRDEFRVKMPDVKITLGNVVKEGREVSANVALTNPLPVTLKMGQFLVEAPGVGKQIKLKIKEDIFPGETTMQMFTFRPCEPGRQVIAVKFKSKQLNDVDGFLPFVVEPI